MTDPTEIHPEHDEPTPENRSDWTEEQLDRWQEAKRQQLQQEAQENRVDLDEDQEAALEALSDPEREDTAEVDIGQTTLQVKTYLSGEMERKWQRVQSHQDDPDRVVDTIAELLEWLVVDEDYADEEVWLAYRERYGTAELMLAFTTVLEPYVDNVQEDQRVQKFREVQR